MLSLTLDIIKVLIMMNKIDIVPALNFGPENAQKFFHRN